MMGAIISQCGQYRYQLDRGAYDRTQPWMCWVMLNPSTADASNNDPTIRRCIGYANAWSIPGFDVVNLYALRTPYPNGLWSVDDPIGPENDEHVRRCAARADLIVLAWGANPGPLKQRGSDVMQLLWEWNDRFRVLGWTKHGEPNHPLMMPKHLELRRTDGKRQAVA